MEKPKFPQYAAYSKRLESFDNWPEHIPVKKEDLVEAGLVYTGVGDSVRCYYCGGGLRNWEREDVPMEEHAKWYPKCPHTLQVKGQAYIEQLTGGERPDEDCAQTQADSVYTETNSLNSIPAQSCIQMGYSKEMVKKAINIYINKIGNKDYKAKDLLEIILDMEGGCDDTSLETDHVPDSQTATDNSNEDVIDELDQREEAPLAESDNRVVSLLANRDAGRNEDTVFLCCDVVCRREQGYCPRCEG